VNKDGYAPDEIFKHAKAGIFGLWHNKDGYALSSFTTGIRGPGNNIPNPATGFNDPDPATVNDY
jgi:hypothetical protein